MICRFKVDLFIPVACAIMVNVLFQMQEMYAIIRSMASEIKSLKSEVAEVNNKVVDVNNKVDGKRDK